jgi:hypothetical protein
LSNLNLSLCRTPQTDIIIRSRNVSAPPASQTTPPDHLPGFHKLKRNKQHPSQEEAAQGIGGRKFVWLNSFRIALTRILPSFDGMAGQSQVGDAKQQL